MAKNYAKRDFKNRPTHRPSRNFGWLWLITGLLLGLFGASLFFLKKHVIIVESPQSPSQAHMASPSKQPLPKSNSMATDTPTKTSNDAQPQPASNGDVKYDFYTMLPQMQVQKGNQPTDTTVTTPPPSRPTKPLAEAEQSMFASQSMANGTPPTNQTSTTAESAQQSPPVAAAPKVATKPTAVAPAPTSDTKYLINFGSFSSFEKADARKAELIMAGIENAKIESTIKDSVTWYRVILGPYKSKASAEKMLAKAQNQQLNGTIINATP